VGLLLAQEIVILGLPPVVDVELLVLPRDNIELYLVPHQVALMQPTHAKM
jgi:hypothetical protein